ncbi:response regulator [Fontimonas sp. SYSU GA230001]|uniref:response regulator transcription factor n=1 Tax=Fontimonas sp. SYSU GA230001 TaxID=3142450 RepID=UPI0032B4C8CB
MRTGCTVFVVDDEEPICDSIALLLRSVGLSSRTFTDPRRFLEALGPGQAGCVVLDVRMPGMNGLDVQRALNERRCSMPLIFITGHGDVPMAVEAMRNGAFDFLQKPFNDDDLIRRVQKALEQDARDRTRLAQIDETRRRWEALTAREREIAERLVDGAANKVIALDLDISERTVELHRARVMQKMEARSFAQLVQMVLSLRQGPAAP